jgi:fatty acid desaturase
MAQIGEPKHLTQVELAGVVQWRDLLPLRKHEIANELLLSAPWLVGSLFAASNRYYVVALACSFMFFLTGLRQVHNAFHYALGLPRVVCDCVMLLFSVLMLGSMHAVQINHLRHHRYCMAHDDIEAMGARRSALGAILLGPWYPWCLHRKALGIATPVQRTWIFLELSANCVWIVVVFLLLDYPALQYQVLAMAAGQCLTAFFAVWTTHHGCLDKTPIARTIRNRFKAMITYNMFYHFEHHTFPSVPTCKLPILASRIDASVPDLYTKHVY